MLTPCQLPLHLLPPPASDPLLFHPAAQEKPGCLGLELLHTSAAQPSPACLISSLKIVSQLDPSLFTAPFPPYLSLSLSPPPPRTHVHPYTHTLPCQSAPDKRALLFLHSEGTLNPLHWAAPLTESQNPLCWVTVSTECPWPGAPGCSRR